MGLRTIQGQWGQGLWGLNTGTQDIRTAWDTGTLDIRGLGHWDVGHWDTGTGNSGTWDWDSGHWAIHATNFERRRAVFFNLYSYLTLSTFSFNFILVLSTSGPLKPLIKFFYKKKITVTFHDNLSSQNATYLSLIILMLPSAS